MADRHVADQRAEHVLVEHLRDQPLIANRHDAAAVRSRRDPSRLLSAVLKREQGEIGQPGDVVVRCVDPEDATFVARPIAMIVHRRHSAVPLRGQVKASSGPYVKSVSPPACALASSETASLSLAPMSSCVPPTRPITVPSPATASSGPDTMYTSAGASAHHLHP